MLSQHRLKQVQNAHKLAVQTLKNDLESLKKLISVLNTKIKYVELLISMHKDIANYTKEEKKSIEEFFTNANKLKNSYEFWLKDTKKYAKEITAYIHTKKKVNEYNSNKQKSEQADQHILTYLMRTNISKNQVTEQESVTRIIDTFNKAVTAQQESNKIKNITVIMLNKVLGSFNQTTQKP